MKKWTSEEWCNIFTNPTTPCSSGKAYIMPLPEEEYHLESEDEDNESDDDEMDEDEDEDLEDGQYELDDDTEQ